MNRERRPSEISRVAIPKLGEMHPGEREEHDVHELREFDGLQASDTGFVADGELDWHSNQSGALQPVPCVALHGEQGTSGSLTEYCENNINKLTVC